MTALLKTRCPFRIHWCDHTVLMVPGQNLPGESWFWGWTSGMSQCAAAWRRPTSFVSECRREEKEADRPSERDRDRELWE